MTYSHELATGWTMSATGGPFPTELDGLRIPTSIPATSHTVLLDAGLIPDPLVDLNEAALSWMKHVDWRFERALDLPAAAPDERVDLVLEGLDTVATIGLASDGIVTELGRTANMHRSYRFDVRSHAGETTLTVDLASALAHAEREALRLGSRPLAYAQPYNMVRKMASSFGWDWGPDLQTAGLWKPVRLERWRVARLAQVRPLVSIDADGTGRVEFHITIERSGLVGGGVPLTVLVDVGGVTATGTIAPGHAEGVLVVEVPQAPVWWPVGYGDQPLVDTSVKLRSPDGAPLGDWHRRIGFRNVAVDRSQDEHGARFTFVVNGQEVFVRGANWIPDDQLLTRITRERLAARIDQALGANMNLLRVWGGGIYESEDFYELCDERGVLVWQDFLLACAGYPEESPIREEIEAEAREHVSRLAAHPALVMWNGGNENVWGHEDWHWKEALDGRTWGEWYALTLFTDIVAELDPTRFYNPNSPSSPGYDPLVVHPNDPNHGTHHEWEVWNRIDYTRYRENVPRFCSEFGFQGPPAWSTMQRGMRPTDGAEFSKDDAVFLLHQKAEDGNAKLDRGLEAHLGVPSDFADWHWATQLNQARAVQFAIEHYRSWWPRTAGAIVWQLNDCWPVTSWAAIDGEGRCKPLWFGLKHAYADRLVTVQPRKEGDVVHLVNDSGAEWTGTLRLSRQLLDGTVLASSDVDVSVAARTVTAFVPPSDLTAPQDETREVLVVDFAGAQAIHTWVDDIDLVLDPSPLDATVAPTDDGYAVTVTARSLARDVTLLVDRLDAGATVDDALVTLTAGSSVTFAVHTARQLDVDALTSRPVLRTANDVRAVVAMGTAS